VVQALRAWWERLLIWLGVRTPALEARLEFGPLREAVARVEAMAAVRSNQPPLIRVEMHRALQLLGALGERLDGLAGALSEGLRADGLELAALARLAAAAVGARGMRHEEERALGLAAHSVLRVASAEHHLVGPAMLAWADATGALGRTEQALTCYRAMVTDFSALLELAELDEEDLSALRHLQTALARLEQLGQGEPAVAARVAARLGAS
jgi:hypothetical protein